MRENQLLKGTIIRTIFVFVELVALVVNSRKHKREVP